MKMCLYIAASLDGYIAGIDDDMSRLDAAAEFDTDYGYDKFYQSMDALVMGGAPMTGLSRKATGPTINRRG